MRPGHCDRSGPGPGPVPWLRAVVLPRAVIPRAFLPLSLGWSGNWRFLNLFERVRAMGPWRRRRSGAEGRRTPGEKGQPLEEGGFQTQSLPKSLRSAAAGPFRPGAEVATDFPAALCPRSERGGAGCSPAAHPALSPSAPKGSADPWGGGGIGAGEAGKGSGRREFVRSPGVPAPGRRQ